MSRSGWPSRPSRSPATGWASPTRPLALIVLREAPTETQGTASSALSLMDTLGTAIGTGVSGAIVAAGLRATGEVSVGLAAAFAVSIAVGIGGFAISGRLRRPRVGRCGRPSRSPTRSDPPPSLVHE